MPVTLSCVCVCTAIIQYMFPQKQLQNNNKAQRTETKSGWTVMQSSAAKN